ncbi:dephospho-CoA kinase [Marinomonas sp. C2222]|uniref:Dephospho-CoA kinase n=1 Tax=Marinomonas sargassi TaxID=2984494 RepID=A0ABT2YSM1_9GAMM|nr:dephospho-CoA kinase [Marinomonas sargassi]MCV2402893.1 dephospho-CoA kinase [Marinomonas sargassi]
MIKQTPPVIGLAGGIGSGKSTITSFFHKLGVQSVDADDIARLVVEPGSYCLHKIVQRYGEGALLPNGELDRATLRNIIFNEPSEKTWLESLTHPVIREEIAKQLSNATSSYVLLVHPLLFETKQNTQCQLVIAIDVPEHIQVDRVVKRDTSDAEMAKKIINTQLNNQERLKMADLVFENSGNLDDMSDRVLTMHNKIIELIKC